MRMVESGFMDVAPGVAHRIAPRAYTRNRAMGNAVSKDSPKTV